MAGSTEPGDNPVRMEGGSSASDELVEKSGGPFMPVTMLFSTFSLCFPYFISAFRKRPRVGLNYPLGHPLRMRE